MSTNLLDLPWIPVTGPLGVEYLTLHDTLVRSSELTDLGPTDSPAEMDALLRFLIAMATLVIREGDGEVDPNDAQAVRAVLNRYRDRFNLFDPDRPFAQEWHVTAAERAGVRPLPMDQLHVHAPGASSAWWCLRTETRDAADPTVLPLLLLTAWYDRANSNAGAPAFYQGKRISGMPPAAVADGWFDRTSFYLMGENLADTLSLNIPRSWENASDLPTWLDQDTKPSPAKISNGNVPLWRYTWTPNRALVFNENGLPVGWASGLTRRGVPEMGEGQANARAVVGADHHALMASSTNMKSGKSSTHRLRLIGDLLGTQGLEHWYRERIGRRLTYMEYRDERHLEESKMTRIGAYVDLRDKSNDAKSSNWIVASRKLLTIPESDTRDVLFQIVGACTSWNLNKSLAAALGVDPKKDQSMLDIAQSAIFAAMDRTVLPALGDLADGRSVDPWQVAQQATRDAIHTFDTVTKPLVTPASIPAVSEARRTYATLVRHQLKALNPRNNNNEEAA